MGPADLAIAAAVLALAGWLLARSLGKGGGCAGCSQRGACQSGPPPLVRLGSGRGAPRR
jgi:hypothetical protein